MSDQLATLVAQLKERRALTFQERIKSLDIRDDIWRKYIELNKGTSFDANAAQRTGLCPDMCCERERLTREYQRLYKSYELDPDTRSLNHSLMVTEYSRASADQAMPSAYDLRSGPALLQTMNYLITNIMDKFDQERGHGDWYNFLWDRLRAIRKELTQQHIRDETAIEVLEQCTRFHIFCSAFSSEYSRDLFDPNLNDKAIIDCLNQLRDCYLIHQQQNNNTQALKNMAEFASYMLLINLKDDNNTLIRIRPLIQDITDRSEIKIALNIHRALLINNTTKFFSLIEKQATLLQCCLLNRYFNIIRLKRLSSLNSSTSVRNSDEVRLADLTDILGMDSDKDTRDYLEQLGYIFSSTDPSFVLVPSPENPMEQQQPIVKLSQRLIKSKYRGNLKDIITGIPNTPVMIPDGHVEDSFDLQGCFIGKLPFNLESLASTMPRKAPVEQTIPRSQPLSLVRRPPSESALRSLVPVTTTANAFLVRPRLTITSDLFKSGITTNPTLLPPTGGFAFSGFSSTKTSIFPTNPVLTIRAPGSIFGETPRFPSTSSSIFRIESPAKVIPHMPSPVEPSVTPTAIPKTPDPIVQPPPPLPHHPPPPPPPVVRRLSVNSMDAFIDDLYDEMIDPIIRETTCNIFDELISQWNNRTRQTVEIFNEFLLEEISTIAYDYYNDVEFHERMLTDTLIEARERQRTKYLRRKYFSLWWEKTLAANEERAILDELQSKYHFLTNEQLFEFLTGIQLMLEHDLTVDETTDILKTRRYLKRNRLKKISLLCNVFFEEFLHEEFRSLVIESNDELEQRRRLFENALKKQSILKREHYLRMKYVSLWKQRVYQRKKLRQQQQVSNKRTNQFLQRNHQKKFKDNHQQYLTIKSSFDQLTTDLKQIQLVLDRFSS